MDNTTISVMLFVVISLLTGVVLRLFLKKTFIPYTVGLFILGLLIGLCARFEWWHMPKMVDTVLVSISDMDPYIILYFFLPILIFEASLNMNIHIFKKTFISANLLAIPGVVIALLLTGAILMGLSIIFPHYAHWTWGTAFIFGALISATDPVAVVALLSELKTSKRFSTLVDAESMLNDGTGIVFFMLFFSAYASGGLPFGPFVNFMVTVFGAVAGGIIVGAICIWLCNKAKSEPVLQGTLMIVASYILFYLTNSVFEVSGVIALVAFGLYIAYVGSTKLSPSVNSFMKDFWELMAYIANTLIFIIVGILIAMKCSFRWSDFGILLIVYIGVNVIRYIMIFCFYPIMRKMRYGFSLREVAVLGWGGLRGAVGLTLALLVYYTKAIPEEIGQQTLFLTGGIVTLTLCINATTMGWLLKKMKLTQKSTVDELLNYNIQSIYLQKAQQSLADLKKRDYMQSVDWAALEQYLPVVEEMPKDINIDPQNITAAMRHRVLQQLISDATTLFQEGEISGPTEKKLSLMIEEVADNNGLLPLTEMQNYFKTFGILSARKKGWVRQYSWFRKYYNHHIVVCYDFLRGFIIMHRNSVQMLEELKTAPTIKETELNSIKLIEAELISNIEAAEEQFNVLESNHPETFIKAVNSKAKRILLSKERLAIKELSSLGMITNEEESVMLDEVGDIEKENNKRG